MVVLCCCSCVLGHDAYKWMGGVEFLQISALLRCQGEIHCLGCSLDVAKFGGAYHWGSNFCQKPCQRDFRHGHASAVSRLFYPGQNGGILLLCSAVLQSGIAILLKPL